ncbi:hypothetical protein V5O48_017993, partial [Marasmius crinis-equi]
MSPTNGSTNINSPEASTQPPAILHDPSDIPFTKYKTTRIALRLSMVRFIHFLILVFLILTLGAASHASSTTRSSATTLASGVIPPTEQLAEPEVAPLPDPILSPSDPRVRAEQSAYAAKETSPPGPSSRGGANGRMLVNESKIHYVP